MRKEQDKKESNDRMKLITYTSRGNKMKHNNTLPEIIQTETKHSKQLVYTVQ